MFSFFTGNSQAINSRIKALQGQLDAWEALVHANGKHAQRLETQIDVLREELADHKAALHKLRGQVHGPKAQERGDIPRPPARQVQMYETKDALRRRAGIVAGKYPAAHAAVPDTEHEEDE